MNLFQIHHLTFIPTCFNLLQAISNQTGLHETRFSISAFFLFRLVAEWLFCTYQCNGWGSGRPDRKKP
jgi:hypothetical protein